MLVISERSPPLSIDTPGVEVVAAGNVGNFNVCVEPETTWPLASYPTFLTNSKVSPKFKSVDVFVAVIADV